MPDLIESLRAALAGRYELQREIGRGGTATVHLAHDVRHGRRVAIKVLRPELSAAIGTQRFEREIRIAAALNHPHILPLHDSGEANGLLYSVMPFVEGVSVRERIRKEGPLPIEDALRIAREVGDALAYAHSRGVIHRDIKPDNILLSGDHAVVTDFGIARALDAAEGGKLTETGLVLGTPAYMSPEQIGGSGEVDARSDVYSLGCVLYEMLVGEPAFTGPNVRVIMARVTVDAPRSLRSTRAAIPEAIERAVHKALAKVPADRFATAGEFVTALVVPVEARPRIRGGSAVERIAAAIADNECVLFLGLHMPAGSDGNGAGSIERFIAKRLLGEDRVLDAESPRLARVAQQFEMERGRSELLRRLGDILESEAPGLRDVFRRISRVGFPVIITTSYDEILDEELTRAGRRVRRVLDCRQFPDDTAGEDLLVWLFGKIDREESVIVTIDDLWDFYSAFHTISDHLKALFATRTIVFVGFDPMDESFRHLYAEIARFRTLRTGDCYLLASGLPEAAIAWAGRKDIEVVDLGPRDFLIEVETALRTRSVPRSPIRIERARPNRPYKFLNYYEESDEAIFFGRSTEIRQFASKLHAYALNVLYAPSGSGKTSLIHAGLMPQLRRDGYLPVYARVYDDPEAEIRRAVMAAIPASVNAGDGTELWPWLSDITKATGKPVIVFLDQFEEAFIRFDPAFRLRFAESIRSCMSDSHGHVRFVISLREDFLPRLSEIRPVIPTIFHNEFRLAPLTVDGARVAIVEPLKLFDLGIEPELVDALLEDLTSQGIDPPQLQIVCDTLYDALEPGASVLTLRLYRSLGGTKGVLGNYLDRVLRELAPEDRAPAREILKQLVTSEETKAVSQLQDLARLVGHAEDVATRVLGRLSDQRLVRRIQREEGFWYELTHEYLVDEIRGWLNEKEKQLKKIRELLEQAVRNHRHLGILMPISQVRIVREHEAELSLSKEELQLLRASETVVRSRRKTAVFLAAAVLVLLAVAAVAWRFVYLQSHVFLDAEDRELVSRTTRLGRLDQVETYRSETIRVWRGSPARLSFDRLLGFPALSYETDFTIEQLDPAHRDAIKAGLLLPADSDIALLLRQRLGDPETVRELIVRGESELALQKAAEVFSEAQVASNDVKNLGSFLVWSGLVSPELVGRSIESVLSPGGFIMPFMSLDGLTEAGGALIDQLQFVDRDQWFSPVASRLRIEASRASAIGIIGALGRPADASLIAPYLEDRAGMAATATLAALKRLGDCSHVESAFRLARNRESDQQVRAQAAAYIARCGSDNDRLALLDVAAANAGDGYIVNQIARALHIRLGQAAVPHILRLSQLRPDDVSTFSMLRSAQSPEVLQAVRARLDHDRASVRMGAALLLARSGNAEGIRAAASTAADTTANETDRVRALDTFEMLSGSPLRAFLLALWASAGPEQSAVRAATLGALRWYADDEVLTLLTAALKDESGNVRDAAVLTLSIMPDTGVTTWLRERRPELDLVSQVYVESALAARTDSGSVDLFRSFLEEVGDTLTDAHAIERAAASLRHSLHSVPIDLAYDALGSPARLVRIAAGLALIEHPELDRNDVLNDSTPSAEPARSGVIRARWARNVSRLRKSQLDTMMAVIERRDLDTASRLDARLDFVGVSGFQTILAHGLMLANGPGSPGLDNRLLDFGSTAEALQYAREALQRRNPNDAVARLVSLIERTPALKPQLLRDPRFQSLHGIYEFDIAFGLRRPTVVTTSLHN